MLVFMSKLLNICWFECGHLVLDNKDLVWRLRKLYKLFFKETGILMLLGFIYICLFVCLATLFMSFGSMETGLKLHDFAGRPWRHRSWEQVCSQGPKPSSMLSNIMQECRHAKTPGCTLTKTNDTQIQNRGHPSQIGGPSKTRPSHFM